MIELYNADCLDKMKELPDKSVDLVLTDPPYGTTACKWDSIIPLEPMWQHLKRVIKPNGAIVLFGSEPFSSYLRMSNIKNYKYDWYWQKDKGANIAKSHKMPLKIIETISVFYKKQCKYEYEGEKLLKPYTHARCLKSKIGDRTNGFLSGSTLNNNINDDGSRIYRTYTHKTKTSMVYFPRESSTFKGAFHPTQKPVALMEYLIKTYTSEGETVLDFTMGSGTTGVACKLLNRNFIGIELSEEYYKIAQNRINQTEQGLF